MQNLTLKLPSFLRFNGMTRVVVSGSVDPHNELNYLSDRSLADIGLTRRGDRHAPGPFWLP